MWCQDKWHLLYGLVTRKDYYWLQKGHADRPMDDAPHKRHNWDSRICYWLGKCSDPLCKPCTPHVNKGGNLPISSPVIVLSTNYHHSEGTKEQSIEFFSRPHTRDPSTPTTIPSNHQGTYAQESKTPPIHNIKCQGTTRRLSWSQRYEPATRTVQRTRTKCILLCSTGQ